MNHDINESNADNINSTDFNSKKAQSPVTYALPLVNKLR